MRFLGRLVMLFVGLIFAIPAAAVTLAIGAFLEPSAHRIMAFLGAGGFDVLFGAPLAPQAAMGFFMGLWTLSLIMLIGPVTFVALAGEATGTRSFVFYAGLTGAITAAVPWLLRRGFAEGPALAAEGRITALLFVTGAVAGLVYWFCAGHGAGRPKEDQTQ